MEIDEKKKRMMLYAALLVVFGGVSAFMLCAPSASKKVDEDSRNIVIEIPEGETDVLNESKSSAYKVRERQPNEIYYDRLGKEVADTGHISLTSVADEARPMSSKPTTGDIVTGEVFPETRSRATSAGTVRQTARPRQSAPVMTPEERMEYDLKRAEAMRQVLMEEPEVKKDTVPSVQKSAKPESSSSVGDGIISSLDDEDDEAVTSAARPVRCMFVKDEKVKNGQRVGIRILEDFRCGGVVIPENTHLAAVCSLSGRLELMVSSFEMNGRIYPINLKAYDIDGYEGIYCPESAAVKGRKKVSGEVVSTAGTALSGLVGGVAGKIVRTGASLLTSASGEQSVQIASGYEFYLMEEVKR